MCYNAKFFIINSCSHTLHCIFTIHYPFESGITKMPLQNPQMQCQLLYCLMQTEKKIELQTR